MEKEKIVKVIWLQLDLTSSCVPGMEEEMPEGRANELVEKGFVRYASTPETDASNLSAEGVDTGKVEEVIKTDDKTKK